MIDRRLLEILKGLCIQTVQVIDQMLTGDKYRTIPEKHDRQLLQKIKRGEWKAKKAAH